MIVANLISKNIPQLSLEDKVGKALSLMSDFEIHHLCIVQKDKFIGLVSKDALLNVDENLSILVLQDEFTHSLVFEQDHFSKALSIIEDKKLSIIPVLNTEKDFVGVIVADAMLNKLAAFIGANEPGGIIILEMERRNYSFSEICRLVETNDAIITQLNTQTNTETGLMTVTIKINKNEIADIIATLQRFEYNVTAYFGEEAYANELQENYNHLLHYLNI